MLQETICEVCHHFFYLNKVYVLSSSPALLSSTDDTRRVIFVTHFYGLLFVFIAKSRDLNPEISRSEKAFKKSVPIVSNIAYLLLDFVSILNWLVMSNKIIRNM